MVLSDSIKNAILAMPYEDDSILTRARVLASYVYPNKVVEGDTTNPRATGRRQTIISFMGKLRIKPSTEGYWRLPTIEETIKAGLWFGREWCVPAVPDELLIPLVERIAKSYAGSVAVSTIQEQEDVTPLTLSDYTVDVENLMKTTFVDRVRFANDIKTTRISIYDFLAPCNTVPYEIHVLRNIQDKKKYEYAKATTLPGAALSVNYKGTRGKTNATFNGFYCGDFDKVPADEVKRLYREVYAQEGVIGVGISSSGKGIRVLLYSKWCSMYSLHRHFVSLASNLDTVKYLFSTAPEFKIDPCMSNVSQVTFIVSNFAYKTKSKIFIPVDTEPRSKQLF